MKSVSLPKGNSRRPMPLMSSPLSERFLSFTELNVEALRRVILSNHTDDEVLAWVQEPAKDLLLQYNSERVMRQPHSML